MSKNYAVIIQFVLPLRTFYRPRAQRSDVYKRDAFMTSWRFHNRPWQLRCHDRLPETSGTLWIHRGALTNQRCSLATGCGIKLRRSWWKWHCLYTQIWYKNITLYIYIWLMHFNWNLVINFYCTKLVSNYQIDTHYMTAQLSCHVQTHWNSLVAWYDFPIYLSCHLQNFVPI